jgi:hypothetical protein
MVNPLQFATGQKYPQLVKFSVTGQISATGYMFETGQNESNWSNVSSWPKRLQLVKLF